MRKGQGPFGQRHGQPGERRFRDERHDADHDVFHFLLQNHKQISRTVNELPNGVQTITESDVPAIADKIKEHVEWMQDRIENVRPIRMGDPLFAALFKNADKINMVHETTEKGVQVTETSEDPEVVKLIQEHAKVVSRFVEYGHAEAMKKHAVRSEGGAAAEASSELQFPVIEGHGGVIQLPDAAMQPRDGTKLLVDITQGGDPTKLNNAIVKVAKFLNIYSGGGAKPASAQIALVFHGDATLAVLNSEAYAIAFDTEINPNLELLRKLHEADVEMYVCGQSLISKGFSPDDTAVFVQTAVSALTAVVNLQTQGYAFVPLGN
ncbi:MAG: DsrE family protein [Pirellulaceae bacterium]